MIRALPLLAVVLFGSAFQVSRVLDDNPLMWDKKMALSVWTGDSLRRFFAGYESAMADIYWLRAVQYHGGEVAFNPESKLDLLETYLDVTTTLDPRFRIAYRYGAIYLSEGRFGANNPAAGIKLLEKGLRHMPGDWYLAQDRALVTSIYLKDGKLAAERCEEASRMPGAPAWLKVMAATFLADGGSLDAARAMWKKLAAESEEDFVRASAQRFLDRHDAIDQAKELTKLVPAYRERFGRDPTAIEDLLAAGFLREAPRDSSGTPFSFDPVEKRVRVNRVSNLYLEGL